jgi:hypothetical protein
MRLRSVLTSVASGILGFGSLSILPPALWAQAAPAQPAQQQQSAPPAKPAAPQPAQPTAPAAASATQASPTPAASSKYIEVPSGTRLPLVLHNAISTRSAHTGDSVYLETLFPILLDGKIVIPAGSYVSGEVVQLKHVRRVHGYDQLLIRLNNLILPNGYEANFNATPTDAGTGGNETVDNEGTIKAGSDKANVAVGTVSTAGEGALIGAVATQTAKGAGIGAGIGAAGSLLASLFTHGPAAELPRGTTLDVSLNRPLYLLSDKINFTTPGQASTLAGPPNRESRGARPRIPLIPY